MAEGGHSPSPCPSLLDIMREQELEEEAERISEEQTRVSKTPKKNSRSRRSKRNFHDDEDADSNGSRRGPFEESFDNSQTLVQARQNSARQHLSPREIDNLARQIIGEISESGNYVSLELVKARMCVQLGVRKLTQLGYRDPDSDIPELKELHRLHSKLDLYGRAYVMVHSIATLTELGQSMARLVDKNDFSELKVGPLVKLPVVFDLFKAPSDDVVLQNLTTMKVLKKLNQYLTQEEKWTSKVILADFMQFLCNEYDCQTPYELGIRLQSVGLGISVLKRAQKAQSERSKEVEKELISDLEKEFERRCKKIKDDLLGSSHGDERSLLGKLLGSSVTDILTKIYEHCSILFQNHHTIAEKDLRRIERCLESLVENRILREFFGLALHMGCKSIVSDILDECKVEMIEIRQMEEKERKQTTKPRKGKLVSEIEKWLNGAEDLKLSILARIEDRVIDPYRPDYQNFHSFGYGTFLDFLSNENELGKILEERGALLGNVNVNLQQSRDKGVLDFIQQCGLSSENWAKVQSTVCNFYNVETVKELGLEGYDSIVSEIQRKPQPQQTFLFYESAILFKDGLIPSHIDHTSPTTTPLGSAGLLGWKTPDDALKALKSTPLLYDVTEWTQWTTVFKPCLGDLKQFIENHAKSEIQVLETENKSLLRIDTNTSLDRFYDYVDKHDVIGASGTLVSLVVKYDGIKATPLTLITNHMKPALTKLASADQEDCGHSCPQFVLQCLCRLPVGMCMALAEKVFLEPLGVAVGSTNSCNLLLSCCANDAQRNRLHHLGLGLGKSEWMKDFELVINGDLIVSNDTKKIILNELKPVAIVKPVVEEETVETERMESEESTTEEISTADDEDENVKADDESSSDITEDIVLEPNPYKAIIDTIRKEEFGVGVVLGKEGEKLVQKQREREGRSLHSLSAELYNRDTHFVLELVQNADDNTYPETEIPALSFVVDSKRIMVLNNEVGFSEKNIRALCDVGKSTKGPHQYGYIGQKGIGFKSVFRISNTPEVHSSGYHIRFDANSGPSGFILPHWIGEESEKRQNGENQMMEGNDELDEWMTKIVLPLKEEFHGDKKTSLSARFHDVHPSLLLFLHRLRNITIVKDNKVQKMTRMDLDNGIIEISHGNGKDRWLVVKKQLKASNVRADVEMTELALAFPMPDDKDCSKIASYKTLTPQNVFAYLPLRSYGFKFIIQGDFEVPSSREDVDGDKAWNQWLREEIPKLFIDALETFKSHPLFPGLSSVAKFFQFVPLDEEILDFFAPVASAILKYLQGLQCLPVEVDNDSKTDNIANDSKLSYDWKQPCSVVVCDDREIRAFITPKLLLEHLKLSYLAQDVSSVINPALRVKLGVQILSARHVIDIGKAVLQESASGKLNDIKWISQWLHCIDCCLKSEHNSSTDILDEIASMNVFPLSDNRLVNLKDHTVFFPISIGSTSKKSKQKSKASYLSDLERDLSVLHPDMLTNLGNVVHSKVEKLLTDLGVKSWTPNDVIHNHILPLLRSNHWKEKSDAVLRSYLVYIFDQCFINKDACSMDELKLCCQVLTNQGPTNPSRTPVHFTPPYGYELDLREQLPCINWRLLDDSYLGLSTHPSATKKDWETFFSALGVGYFLAIERKSTKLTKLNVVESPWKDYHKNWTETSDGCFIVDDYHSGELEEFMKSSPKDPRQAKIIAENLDKRWTEYSSYAIRVPVKDPEGRDLQQSTPSSFWHYLREESWLPVKLSSQKCEIPRELFCDSDDLRLLLDEHVSYCGVKVESESFATAIGLVSSISVEDLLKHVIQWSSNTRSSRANMDHVFITSLAHMRSFYAFLQEKCQFRDLKSKIVEAFQKNPLLYVPNEPSQIPEPDKRVQGKFYPMKEVCWNDPSEVTQKLQSSKKYSPKRQILSPYYRESHDFLRLTLRVDSTPHTDEYIEMAAVLVEGSSFPTPSVLESVLEIFAVLGEKCHKPTYERPSSNANITDVQIDQNMARYLKEKLPQEAIFPCGEKWVTLSDKPILPDNKQLKKIFEMEKSVHFITLECFSTKKKSRTSRRYKTGEEKRNFFVSVFLKACGVENLSNIVEEELTPKNVEYQCHEIQLYFHKVVPCIQRYLFSHVEERYKQLKEESFGKKLSDMKFATVTKLEVVYHLEGHSEVTIGQEMEYGFETVGQNLFFYAKRQQSKGIENLNKAIAKLFINGISINFGNFLSSLSNKLDDGLDNFLDEQEIETLPDSEEMWFIPEPDAPSTPEMEIPDDVLPPPIQRRARTDNDGELHCWPPRSSVTGIKPTARESKPSQQMTSEHWPQPEAPESMRSEPHIYQGPRLQSLPARQNVETAGEGSNNQVKVVENKDTGSDQAMSAQSSSSVENVVTSPPTPKDNPVEAPDVVGIQPDTESRCLQQVPLTPTIGIPGVTCLPISTPYLNDGTMAQGYSPIANQLLTSTPRSVELSPSVFSPDIAVTLEDLKYDEFCPEVDVPLPINVSLNSSSDGTEIGRWGEGFVYEFLKSQMQPADRTIRVEWVNQEANSTLPYDLKITNQPLIGAGDEIVTYIEVKSTSASDKDTFEISVPELVFALQQHENLHLYRVFNAGQTSQGIRILRFQNLAKHLERKTVKMFIVI